MMSDSCPLNTPNCYIYLPLFRMTKTIVLQLSRNTCLFAYLCPRATKLSRLERLFSSALLEAYYSHLSDI